MDLGSIVEIDLEITSHCNLHCPQCPRFDNLGHLSPYLTLGHLDLASVRRHIDLARLPNLNRVILEGDHGDALAHPDLIGFLEHFASVPVITIVTNGSMRLPRWWQRLAQIPNVQVTFSIDGLEDTNALYRINARWSRIMDNVKAFIASGGHATWKMLVFQHNQHQVDQVRALADSMGFRDMRIEYTNRSWSHGDVYPVYVAGNYMHNIRISDKSPPAQPASGSYALTRLDKNFVVPTCAWRRHGKIYINYLGHVLPCCMTSSRSWAPDISGQLWRRITGDVHDLDINHHCLHDILAKDFFQHRLQESLADPGQVHHVCVSNCS